MVHKISRFYSLDILRGLAALSVVFFHWGNFFGSDASAAGLDPSSPPYYHNYSWLFYAGGRAVDVFFCLSGFIFTWLYAKSIQRHEISAHDFFWLRFSRLYPLHFITLIFVAVSQLGMKENFGSYFVYPHLSAGYFILQIFLASNWFTNNFSFNGPIWSVSVEVLLYFVFFLLCRMRWFSVWHRVALVVAGYFAYHYTSLQISCGLFNFFIGTLTFHLYELLQSKCSGLLVAIMTAVTVGVGLLIVTGNFHFHLYKFLSGPHDSKLSLEAPEHATPFPCDLILNPLLLLTLALAETRRGTLGKRFAIIGDLSYSSYLIHFPLQLVFMAVVLKSFGSTTLFHSGWMMALFFAVLIPLCLISYHFLERPAQRVIRNYFVQKSPAKSARLP